MKRIFAILVALVSWNAAFSQNGVASDVQTYQNPVVDFSMPDPTVIRSDDGFYYVYATEDIRNVPIMKSENLTDWKYCGTVFTDKTRPSFEPKGGIWAPDINYIGGKYVLYYAKSVWGGEKTCGIGVAVSDKPEGPFTDCGALFRSNEIGVQNSIDPSLLKYKGRNYLVWGSFRGIYAIELSADGLSVMPKAKKRRIAGTAFEAAYIHYHDGFYYLFASVGTCCQGLKSSYQVVVGRSRSVWRPYKDKDGKKMLDNGYALVIGKNQHFVGNGHGSQIIRDEAGQDWLLYHGVSTGQPDNGRVLLLDQIKWDEQGWPYVEGGSPSFGKRPAPVLNKRK